MPRAQKVLTRGTMKGRPGEIADTLLLKYEDRRRRHGVVFGGRGTRVEFDFAEPPRLGTDDVLVLDDGRLAEVVADVEPVIEVRARDVAKDFAPLARLLVALGNRHIPVQILAGRLRLQKRPDVETLVAAHGLRGAELTAPFEPDDGHAIGHDHDHGHHHGDGHHDHPGEGHGHAHHHHKDSHGHHHHGHGGHHHHDK